MGACVLGQGDAEYQCSAGMKVPKRRRKERVSPPCCASSPNSPAAVPPAIGSEGEAEVLHLYGTLSTCLCET